ncbi:hypothetical protein GGR55DRAFT_72851 [Xylaria sp. FL0064]|nr:hypothetical protein GGR55DRAFT_72851 [Xylaria sp. FL0064]
MIMTLQTPPQPQSLSKFFQSPPSNNDPIDFCANTPKQPPSIQHETVQCEPLSKTKRTSNKWSFIKSSTKPRSQSWSGTETVSSISIPLVNLASQLPEVSNFKQPDGGSLDGNIDSSEVAHTHSQPKEATASNGDNSSHQDTSTSNSPAAIGKGQYNEPITCSLTSKDNQLSPESHSNEVLNSSTCDTPLNPRNPPIRTKLGSSDSDKYALRSFGNKTGLYYSTVIWPEELLHRRRSFLFGQLRTDLNNHIQQACKEKKHKRAMKKHRVALTGQAFTIELRLSGNVDANEDIELRPTIWVLCASEFYKMLVEEALSQCQLSWAIDENIEVVNGLVFNKSRERVENLDFSKGLRFAESYRLHIHIEEAREDNSACGLLTCATITKDGCIIDQCVSRIGGLLLLNQEVVCASSTAHGILDMLMSSGACSAMRGLSTSRDLSDSDTESEIDSDSEDDGESIISADDLDRDNTELPGSSITSGISHWNVVPKVIILDFLQPLEPTLNWLRAARTELRAHDFALFDFGREPFKTLSNSYEYKLVKHIITTTDDSQNVDSRNEIIVLLGHKNFARGRMLPGISSIYMAGAEFSTRRVLLDDPLAPGTSGSWVVSDSSLHGVIIASYGQDPIAHMIPVRQLFCDIKSALPKVLSIVLSPGKDEAEGKSKEIESLPMKQESPVSEGNVVKRLATSSLPSIIIWRLPLNFSETELSALLDSKWNWFDALLLPPKKCEASASRFALVKFRNLGGAVQAKEQLNGKRIPCSRDALIVDIIDYNEVLGRGSYEGLLVSEGETSTTTSASWAVEPPALFASPVAKSVNAHREHATTPVHSQSGGFDGHIPLPHYLGVEKSNKERNEAAGHSDFLAASPGDRKNFAVNDGKGSHFQTSGAGGPSPPCNTLYIANLPINPSEEELKSLMAEQQGYKRMLFRTKQSGPLCFVEFENVAFATKALHELNGRSLSDDVNGGSRPIRATFSKNPLGVRSDRASGQGIPDNTDYVARSSRVCTSFDDTTITITGAKSLRSPDDVTTRLHLIDYLSNI